MGGNQLDIIDISNPSNPIQKGHFYTTDYAYGVEVVGNYAYVAAENSGLQIINISNPAAPSLSGTYDTTGSAYGVQMVGNYAYVADYNSGLQIINPHSVHKRRTKKIRKAPMTKDNTGK